ncbi:hypothetical protein Bpfe_006586 [Biomphalaria pfeifferi]|uniref:Uncharacterized protein n=1 Tax=Biomphalaria pfeifferi TaxID=112525 RepID=A0AAD8C027_BIOPF|nr:hypothetical protein Bpfe_006586 [Biomphalaria pfeifferi]
MLTFKGQTQAIHPLLSGRFNGTTRHVLGKDPQLHNTLVQSCTRENITKSERILYHHRILDDLPRDSLRLELTLETPLVKTGKQRMRNTVHVSPLQEPHNIYEMRMRPPSGERSNFNVTCSDQIQTWPTFTADGFLRFPGTPQQIRV